MITENIFGDLTIITAVFIAGNLNALLFQYMAQKGFIGGNQ